MNDQPICPSCGSTDIRPDYDPDCTTWWCSDCCAEMNDVERVSGGGQQLISTGDMLRIMGEVPEFMDRYGCSWAELRVVILAAWKHYPKPVTQPNHMNCDCMTWASPDGPISINDHHPNCPKAKP